MSKHVFILLGSTGALAKKKIIPVLGGVNAEIILYARRPEKSSFKMVLGELNNFDSLVKSLDKNSKLFFYLALPPNLYGETLKSIKKSFSGWNYHVAVEKPFGTSLKSAKDLTKIIKTMGSKRFYLVDHYLAKEDFIKRKSLSATKKIKDVKIAILESENVQDRGAFYDKVGAIKDTGQNHLLNMLAVLLSPRDKIKVLKNLKYQKGSLITRQYPGYKKTLGVDPNSKTETYFKASFLYKGIGIVLETGKAMRETKSYIKVKYNDGSGYEIKIRSNPGTSKPAHKYVISDFLSGKNKFSLTPDVALESWKVIEKIEKDRN